MRTQLVAARTVAEALVELATGPETDEPLTIPEIAGPRVEKLIDVARLLVQRREAPRRSRSQRRTPVAD